VSGTGSDPGGGAAADHVGDLAIVLHSHMPYVEGFGTYPFGEEWLFDAAIRSYVPLLPLVRDLTMTVTPVLADQLEAPGVGERLLEFTRSFRVGSARLDEGEMETPELRAACAAEAERYERVLDELERRDGNVIPAFAEAQAERGVELIPSSATHAVLPLLATREAILLQLETGLRSHARRFGPSTGFWLPECAYVPGLEHMLDEAEIHWTCVDQSAHEPPERALTPIAAGPLTAFPIDWEAVQWLWSMDGYPSDPLYADFHRKSLRGCRPWAISGDAYDAVAAARRAREQAEEFAAAVAGRLRAHRERAGSAGLLTFAIDTELLGHWWWEGPTWLEAVLERLPEHGVRPVRLGDALAAHPPEPRPLRRSSWGENKDLRTWDSRPVADLVRGARRLELRVLRDVAAGVLSASAEERAARELLAVQASDWAFLDYRRQAGDYPFQRVLDHSRSLFEAIDSRSEQVEPRLRNLAPDLALGTLREP
jgi:1,4-alpha-glucan branching enzyme